MMKKETERRGLIRKKAEGENSLRSETKRFLQEEDGVGVVEVILILVVVIGLIIIFKTQLTSLVNDTFSNITDQAGTL